MKIVCNNEHTACKTCMYYENSIRKVVEFKRKQVENWEFRESTIIFTISGQYSISYGTINTQLITENQMFVVPLGMKVYIKALAEGTVCILPIKEKIYFCEHYKFEQLNGIREDQPEFYSLEITSLISNYLKGYIDSINNGMKCEKYFEIKQNELFLFLYYYYTKQELAGLFHPLLSGDAAFKSFVLEHYTKEKTVKNLATKANLSTRAFHKHFKEIIGVTPAHWMNQEKAKQIRHELVFTNKPIKQIYEDFGFTSASYFNEFCKKNLNNTPAKLRKKQIYNANWIDVS